MNKIDNKQQLEKAIDKLPYSLGNKATEMLKAYVDDDKEKYIALASQFDKENAETAQEVRRLQYGLQCSQEFAALLIPYVQPWLAPKLPQKTDENPNLVAEKVVGNQKVASASKSKCKS